MLGRETEEPIPYLDEKANYSSNYTGSMPSMYETDYTKTYIPSTSSDIYGYSKPVLEDIVGNMYQSGEPSFLENDVGNQTPVEDATSRRYGMTRQTREGFEMPIEQEKPYVLLDEQDRRAERVWDAGQKETVNVNIQETPVKQRIVFKPILIFLLFVTAWFVTSLWVEIAGRTLDKYFYSYQQKTLSLMVIVAVFFTIILALAASWFGIPFVTLESA